MFKQSFIIAAILAVGQSAHADEFSGPLQDYAMTQVQQWASDPVILAALRAANAISADYDQSMIDALDAAWKSEIGTANMPTITPILENAASDFLRSHVDSSDGVISEVFIMDQHGLNAAATAMTSDMWQGDEAKFIDTYNAGAGALHIGDVAFDESAQTYLGQISMTVSDPQTGEMLGAITVGVNAEALF